MDTLRQDIRYAVRSLRRSPTFTIAAVLTRNLDSRTSTAMLELFAGLVRDGQTIVMVSHDQRAAAVAARTITIADGRIA